MKLIDGGLLYFHFAPDEVGVLQERVLQIREKAFIFQPHNCGVPLPWSFDGQHGSFHVTHCYFGGSPQVLFRRYF